MNGALWQFGRRGSHSSSESTSGGSGGEEEQDGLQNFRDVTSAIDKAIEELGGAVVPRLNWSCPKVMLALLLRDILVLRTFQTDTSALYFRMQLG